MKIVEKTTINRPVAKVWPHLIKSEDFQKWNKKVVSMEARGAFIVGQPFVTHYIMSKKPMQCQTMVTNMQHERLLELRHSNPVADGMNTDLECYERFTLEDRGDSTRVIKEIEIRNHQIAWYWLPLIWFITRFGKPKYPDELKQMCEAEV